MNLKKQIGLFLLKFVVIYAIMLLPSTGIGDIYAGFSRSYGEWLFADFGEKGMIRFLPHTKEGHPEVKTKIQLINKEHYAAALKSSTNKTIKAEEIEQNSFSDFLLTATLVALILALPFGLKRILLSLLWGLAILHIYIASALYLKFLTLFHNLKYLEVLQLEANTAEKLIYWDSILLANAGTGIFVVLVIWMGVSFRKSDIAELRKLVIAENNKTH